MAALPLVLDTSVVIKWYRQGEVLADRALALRKSYLEGQITLFAPTLCVYELANALRYKDDLPTDQVQDTVQSLLDMGIEWVSPTTGIMQRAIEIARGYDTTVYDAVFVALALSIDAKFISADQRLVQRLSAFSLIRFLGELEIDSLPTS